MLAESNPVTLNPNEILRLHAEDGLGTEDDLQLLIDSGVDVVADMELRKALKEGLASIEVPALADDVMRRLGLPGISVDAAMSQELSEQPEISVDVMSIVGGSETSNVDIASAIRSEGGDPDSVWREVADTIGVDSGLELGDLIRSAVEHESGPSNIEWMPKGRPYWKVGAAAGVVFAMAAAVLLWVQSAVPNTNVIAKQTLDEFPLFDGPVQIESREVGAANIAQVLQFDEDSPTIIFVGEFEE